MRGSASCLLIYAIMFAIILLMIDSDVELKREQIIFLKFFREKNNIFVFAETQWSLSLNVCVHKIDGEISVISHELITFDN